MDPETAGLRRGSAPIPRTAIVCEEAAAVKVRASPRFYPHLSGPASPLPDGVPRFGGALLGHALFLGKASASFPLAGRPLLPFQATLFGGEARASSPGSCAAGYFYSYRQVKRINEENVAAAKPIIDALQRYRQAAHRYPATLCDLQMNNRPAFAAGTRILFTASRDGSQFWLGIFPFRLPLLILPTDVVNQYSSQSRGWSTMDINDSDAKDDDAWDRNCGAGRTASKGGER